MNQWIESLLDLFFPDICIACENKLEGGEKHICNTCLLKLPKTDFLKQYPNKLEQLLAGKIPFQKATALYYFVKGGTLQPIIHNIKYKGNYKAAFFMGQLAAQYLINDKFFEGIDYLVPVPLHRKRLHKRGFNQSLEICKGISQNTGIPINSKILKRILNNPQQATLSEEKRRSNTQNIFQVTNPDQLYNKHILLVDDVITTGSTIESCVKSLTSTSSCKVSILALGLAI